VSGITFGLRERPPQRVDLSALVPERLAGLSGRDIAALPVHTTRERLALGDLFRIRPGDVADIRFEGGSDRLDHVGEKLSGGRIRIMGEVGARLGRGMTAGAITVEGAAGPYAASGMGGGRVEILGDAGERLGGPCPGEMRGMHGGLVVVRGGAGPRAGDRMRRGAILVAGDVGDHAGSRMIAGTLVALGRAGRFPGTLMKRGTLVFAGGVGTLSPTFLTTGALDLVALRLLARFAQAELGSALPLGLVRHAGDNAVTGKGEIFAPA